MQYIHLNEVLSHFDKDILVDVKCPKIVPFYVISSKSKKRHRKKTREAERSQYTLYIYIYTCIYITIIYNK